ncbi:carboxypeptidase-like regulatory domain-containing protein [Schlesneria paludicola]|uniref:carboxypeptidase-like regulatory domain-containing protein n=1 Tax=Schlesneria paludicola TaxID=360056 RepID=UPI00029A152E|nr:carboxypeptidase-like regulatory domain-containing protein [Schlesneria paludicola]
MNKGLFLLKNSVVALAAVGVVCSPPPIFAGPATQAQPVVKTLPATTILDIRLEKSGAFVGRVVDHSGNPAIGAKIVVKQGRNEVGHAVADQHGAFQIPAMKTGIYQVRSGATEGLYRFWTEQTAPPTATPQGLLVLGENGARGQFGSIGPAGILMVATGAALVAVAVTAVATAHGNKDVTDDSVHCCVSP